MTTQQRVATKSTPSVPVVRPSRLLVPVDQSPVSERAVSPAVALARRLGAELTLFAWHWDAEEATALRVRLHELADRLDPVPFVDVARTDDRGPAGPLLDAARRQPDTLVCMATHARGGVGATLLGSVAEEVVRRATEPVLLVGPHVEPGPLLSGPIVACVDGSRTSEVAIPMAASWSRALRVPLEVVTVIDPTRTPPADGGATAHRSWAEVEADHVARIADGAGVEASWSVLAGDPADAVAGYAQGHASLLALATHGRSGIGRAVAGSVALRIVRRAPCPVLIVRPRELG